MALGSVLAVHLKADVSTARALACYSEGKELCDAVLLHQAWGTSTKQSFSLRLFHEAIGLYHGWPLLRDDEDVVSGTHPCDPKH